jgi:hypothetical protein
MDGSWRQSESLAEMYESMILGFGMALSLAECILAASFVVDFIFQSTVHSFLWQTRCGFSPLTPIMNIRLSTPAVRQRFSVETSTGQVLRLDDDFYREL